MNSWKSYITSKTLWANVIGAVAVIWPKVFALFGVTADPTGQAQAVSYVVAFIMFVLSSIARIKATQQLTSSSKAKALNG